MSKITLKLDESNDLKFKMNIQGSTSEPGATKPTVRFLLTEKDNPNAMGLVFPVLSSEGDTITFTIPALSGVVKVGTTYAGKVEVLIGSRFFVPVSMDIVFTKNLTVEVVQVTEEKEQQLDVVDMLSELEEKPAAKPIAVSGGKKQITLTKSQLEKMIMERKKAVQPAAKPPTGFKDSLKGMLKDALSEDKSD